MNSADLVRLVDRLEDQAPIYLTLEAVEQATGGSVGDAIEQGLLLVDYRMLVGGSQITLCRLNRRHPLVIELTKW